LEEEAVKTLDRKIDFSRVKEKDIDEIETVEEVFDKFTLEALYHVMRELRLARLYGVISSGKEARVYRAIDRSGREYAVKIYLTFTSEFKKGIWKYIMGDPRFERARIGTTRSLIAIWARKEFKNLQRLFRAGVRVPKPYGVKQNIVVMEFIGRSGVRAPLLKEQPPEEESEALKMFEKIMRNVWLSHCRARLVHADLSEYNIMVYEGEPVIIDVGQAVLTDHPNAYEFLTKDLKNIQRYFEHEIGIKVPDVNELYEVIVECRGTNT